MIDLYRATNTDYTKNGDMPLLPLNATVSAEINGAWVLTLNHPIDEEGRWRDIQEGAVVRVPSFNGKQLFRVRKTTKQDSGIEAIAEPIFLDSVGDCFLLDVRPTKQTGQGALNSILSANSKYSGTSDILRVNTAYYYLKNCMEAIAGEEETSFLNRWGGEILYNNYEIIINQQIGSDNGVSLLYGKNISADGIREIVDIDSVVTRIVPKAYNGYLIEPTPYVDSPLIDAYPTIMTKVIEYPNIRLKADVEGDDTEGFTICETKAELYQALTQAAHEEFTNGIDKPHVSIECEMVLLQNTAEYKDFASLEEVSLGDTIHCKHNRLGIVTDARIVALTWDCLTESVASVSIGAVRRNIMDRVASSVNATEKALTKGGDVVASQIKGIINGAEAQLRLQSTAAEPQSARAILFEDLDANSPLYGAMALGTQGFQIANTRNADDTDWEWTTFGTAQGFNADFITAGTLTAISLIGSQITLGDGWLESYVEDSASVWRSLLVGAGKLLIQNENKNASWKGTTAVDVGTVSVGGDNGTNEVSTSINAPLLAASRADQTMIQIFKTKLGSIDDSDIITDWQVLSNGNILQKYNGSYVSGYTGTISASSSIRVVNGIVVGT